MAVFAKVKVDEDLGVVKVTHVVSAIAGGHVLNPKPAALSRVRSYFDTHCWGFNTMRCLPLLRLLPLCCHWRGLTYASSANL